MTHAEQDQQAEERAPVWVKDGLRRIRESFQISGNGLGCETTARADESRGRFTIVVRMAVMTKPVGMKPQLHEVQWRFEEHDIVNFGLYPFLRDRLGKMLGQLAVSAFECGTIFGSKENPALYEV